MTEEVLVRVTGIQTAAGEPQAAEEPISIVTPGRFYTEDGNRYVSYEEVYEEAGMSAVNTVKLHPEVLEVNKSGAINVQMVFQESRKNMSMYGTPFGEIEMGISTTSYTMSETENKIDLDVKYALEMNGEHAADCELKLEIMAKGSDFTL